MINLNYHILDKYNRRGKKIWVTIEISGFGTLKRDDIEYDKSYAWVAFLYDGEKFNLLKETLSTHINYPIPESLDLTKIEELVNQSKVAEKVRKLIKS